MDIFIELFRRYMRTPNTAYALHLDGPWGSGKTHFINNEIRNILDREFPEIQLVYISLNGLRETTEIDENLFLQLVSPSIAKSYVWTRGTITILKHFNPISDSSNLDLSNIDLKLKEIFKEKKLDKILLCFDDLERIDETLSIERLFGYINTNFIEHNCVKTLFLSNSEEIEDSIKFTRLKEKIIGRTIKFSIENDEVIKEIVRKDYSALFPFYHRHMNEMNAIFSSLDKLNLRSVKYVFEVLNEIFNSLKEENISLSDNALMNIFACTLTVGIEYKKGNIVTLYESDELLNPYNLNFRAADPTQDTEPQLINKNIVVSKYFSYFHSIANFVISGHFNFALLKDELNEKYKQPSEEDIHFAIVESYYNYESDVVTESVKKVLVALEQGYYNPVKYPYVYSTLKELIDNSYLDFNQNLFQITKKGLVNALNTLSNTGNLEREHVLNRYFTGYTDEESLFLINMIKTKNNQLREEDINNRVMEFITAIEADDRIHLAKLMSYFSSSENLFENLYKAQFHEKLINMKNRSITLFDIVLNEIYLSIINASDIFHTEVPYMKDFKEILDQEITSLDKDFDALKRGRIKQVSKTIEKVIKHVTKETRNT